jgi:hypothetical protein
LGFGRDINLASVGAIISFFMHLGVACDICMKATSDLEYDTDYDPEKEGSCYWKLYIKYEINLPVNSGIHIDEISTSVRKLSKSVQQQSYVKLLPEEVELALSKLQRRQQNS